MLNRVTRLKCKCKNRLNGKHHVDRLGCSSAGRVLASMHSLVHCDKYCDLGQLTLPGHNPPLREVRAVTQAETTDTAYWLSPSLAVQLAFLASSPALPSHIARPEEGL